jgi:hypothetical protein
MDAVSRGSILFFVVGEGRGEIGNLEKLGKLGKLGKLVFYYFR